MKRAGKLIDHVASPENLRLAWLKAIKGKRCRPEVVRFRENLSDNLETMGRKLLEGHWVWGPYHTFTVYDPKRRTIHALPFADRVAQHAVMNVCDAPFGSYQIHDSYACRKGKGSDACLNRARWFAGKYTWYAHLDIYHFFESIDTRVLQTLLARRFKDKTVLRLFRGVITGYASDGTGIPIGNLTSQYFANHYLGRMDHFIKEELGARAYVRYMDNFVLWDEDKGSLNATIREIRSFLQRILHLRLRPVCLNRTAFGMSFLGYRVFPAALRLTHRSRVRYRRKITGLHQEYSKGICSEDDAANKAMSLTAFVQRADSLAMRRRIFETLGFCPQAPNV